MFLGMIPVEAAFLTIGLIIVAGYLGMLFFKKTRVSEIILLLLIGLVIGPIANFYGIHAIGPLEIQLFEGFLPYFATFALMVILFEGGMQLNFFKMIKALPQSFAFTIMVFILSIGFTTGILIAFGFDLLFSILVGAIIGGTSSAVIIPLINSTSASEQTKTLLGLESALTDALCVIVAVAVAGLIAAHTVNLIDVGSQIAAAFAIAAVFGAAAGFVWLKILTYLRGKPYEYLMTLAFLFLLYSVTQTIRGNGAIAALVFGIILGNSEEITSMLKLTRRSIDSNIKSFQTEISFVTRTFFFVYLGMLFKLEYLNTQVITLTIFIIFGILIARFTATKVFSKFKTEFAKDENLIITSSARGLAAAVLASIPVTMSLGITKVVTDEVMAIAFLIILLTNIITTIGVFITERGKPMEKPNEENYLKKVDVKVIQTSE